MNKLTSITATALLLASLAGAAVVAAEKKPMPKEDVVDVPAIGQGLCVANVFQSNMVLQRDKPLNIWGWAEPGEEVAVPGRPYTRSCPCLFAVLPVFLSAISQCSITNENDK